MCSATRPLPSLKLSTPLFGNVCKHGVFSNTTPRILETVDTFVPKCVQKWCVQQYDPSHPRNCRDLYVAMRPITICLATQSHRVLFFTAPRCSTLAPRLLHACSTSIIHSSTLHFRTKVSTVSRMGGVVLLNTPCLHTFPNKGVDSFKDARGGIGEHTTFAHISETVSRMRGVVLLNTPLVHTFPNKCGRLALGTQLIRAESHVHVLPMQPAV